MKINPKDRCKHQYEVIESWHSKSEDPNFWGSLNFKVRCTKCGEERIFAGCIFMGCGNELEDNDVVKVESFECSSPSEDYTEINRWLAKEHICGAVK